MSVRYLIDENLPPRLVTALRRLDPAIDVLRVGDEGAPARGTLDPDILRFLQASQRLLVTENRVSMPGHVRDHLAAGDHHWGVLRVRPRTTVWRLAEELYLVWEASEADEWRDVLLWIPF